MNLKLCFYLEQGDEQEKTVGVASKLFKEEAR